MTEMADIGVVGLAVMGQNLILNLDEKGFTVCAYNRTISKVEEFLAGPAKGTNVLGARGVPELVASLKHPRRIMLMVKAGSAVDDFIHQLLPHLEAGDIIIDGGNSLYTDTERRMKQLLECGILFVGCGVSGGEEGARHGPSLMPGGAPAAWPHIKVMLQSIAAQVDGQPCCEWVGEGGAGHFVKMVHNGIEYGDMQLICEAYHLMRDGLALSHPEMARVFAQWEGAELSSFLIEITADILAFPGEEGSPSEPLLTKIRDVAGQKGTGKWTVEAALEMASPMTMVSEAVFARALSARKEERVRASAILPGAEISFTGNQAEMIDNLRQALYAAKLISYAQGFMLFRSVSQKFGWNLNYGAIATMWKGGCIIRSAFLSDIKRAFDQDANLENLLFDSFFRDAIARCQGGWRKVLAEAVLLGIPVPALSSALAFYDGYRCERLPANLLQAQRDYFGAHTFEFLHQPGVFHHVNWTGGGGSVASTNYQA